MTLSGFRDWNMGIKAFSFLLLLLLISCRPAVTKEKIERVLGIEEANEWLLVIHPAGCKTCLDQLYQELGELELKGGAIVLVARNSKDLRMSDIYEQSPVPLYLDEQKVLLKKGLIEYQDQLLLFTGKTTEKYEALEYQLLIDKLKQSESFYAEH